MTRKKFGISQSLSRGITETVTAVKNNIGALRYEVLPLSRIEIDPNNPRELAVTPQDIEVGLRAEDPLYQRKKEEVEKLGRLGETIKKKGLINAVVVYKRLEKYRLAAGERRFLACLLIGKEDIQARVYDEEPSEDDLRMIQWIENTEREDLSLKERLGNIRLIISGFQKKHPSEAITATFISDLLSVSLPHASNYLSLLNASRDLSEKIENGKINSIEKGAFLARIQDSSTRTRLIKECESGASLRELQSMLTLSHRHEKESKKESPSRRVGKPLTRINMGITRDPQVVMKIVRSVVERPEFKKFAVFFDKIKWQDLDEAKKAFKKLIELLESENAKR